MAVSLWIQLVSKGKIVRGEVSVEYKSALTLMDVIVKAGKIKRIKLDKLIRSSPHITILVNHRKINYPDDSDIIISDDDTIDIMQHIVGG